MASIYAHLLQQIKRNVYIRKEFNSHRTGLGQKHGRRFIGLGQKYGRHNVTGAYELIINLLPTLVAS